MAPHPMSMWTGGFSRWLVGYFSNAWELHLVNTDNSTILKDLQKKRRTKIANPFEICLKLF